MTDKLLQVLDMTEEEKAVALYNLGHDVINDRCRVHWNWMADGTGRLKSLDNPQELPYIDKRELAGLAFRSRNEVENRPKYYRALRLIFRRWSEKKQSRGIDFRCWLGTFITPTDMIVAALKAKEPAKE